MAEMLTPEVVDVLVQRHRRFLQFLEPRVGSRAVAEELLQAAFVKAVEHGSELREGERAVAWFYRLLRNALVNFYRWRDAERRAIEQHAGEASMVTERDPDLDAAVCECVHRLIPTLRAEYADILRAVEMEGQGLADVARRLAITPGNAAVRLHRARLALKGQLEASCGACTEHGCLDCTCKAPKHA